jgi:predicted permease
MIDGETILSAIYAVINLIIPVLIGFMLSKIGVLTPVTRKVLSDVNYYAVCPIYCIYFVMQSIDKNRLTDLGIIFWSALPCIIIAFAIMLSIAYVLKLDIRILFSYCFIHVYGNVVIMPQMLADSLCERGGKYEFTTSCTNKLVKPYTSVPFIYMNILYWVTTLPMLQEERRIALIVKKVELVTLNFYDTIDEFVADSKTYENARFIGNHNAIKGTL